MRARATIALAAALAAVTLDVRVRTESATTLIVRLYNGSAIPAAQLLAARSAAGAILRDAGLDVVFRHCGHPMTPEAAIDRCEEPLRSSEVVVRVIPAPPFSATLDPEAYGVTYVVRDTDRGWLATVFSDRITAAAARVDVDAGTLLGRVMAHEVGHLLLGHGYHGASGVMRADWPDAMLSRKAEDWRFSTDEAARIHRALIHF